MDRNLKFARLRQHCHVPCAPFFLVVRLILFFNWDFSCLFSHHIDGIYMMAFQPAISSIMAGKPTDSLKPKKPVLRHVEDIRQLGFTALFFAVFLFTWLSFRSPLSHGLVSLAFWLSLFQLSFMGAVSTHNAIHAPVFWDTRLNSFYQVCLSLQYGFSVSVFIPGHNLSHHKYPQQARDFSEYRRPCLRLASTYWMRGPWLSLWP